jgi:hypothetical protein
MARGVCWMARKAGENGDDGPHPGFDLDSEAVLTSLMRHHRHRRHLRLDNNPVSLTFPWVAQNAPKITKCAPRISLTSMGSRLREPRAWRG